MVDSTRCSFARHSLAAREDRAFGLCPLCAAEEIQLLNDKVNEYMEAARVLSNEVVRLAMIVKEFKAANDRLADALKKELKGRIEDDE